MVQEVQHRPVLMREILGESLRELRTSSSLTLREVSGRAQVSLGYLSEIERGQKEASSELLNAICGALDVPLADVLRLVSDRIDSRAGAQVTQLPLRPRVSAAA
jgi:transcriptional regulator with XRE-family HTH domain